MGRDTSTKPGCAKPRPTWPGTRDPFQTRNSQLGRSHLHVLRNKCLGLKLTASKGSSSTTSAPHSCSTESLAATTAMAKSCKTSCKPLPKIPANQSLGRSSESTTTKLRKKHVFHWPSDYFKVICSQKSRVAHTEL